MKRSLIILAVDINIVMGDLQALVDSQGAAWRAAH